MFQKHIFLQKIEKTDRIKRIVEEKEIFMKNICLFLILGNLFCVLFTSCQTNTLELGGRIPDGMIIQEYEGDYYVLLNSATIIPLFEYSEYIYIGALDDKIAYIEDANPNREIDGLRIGDKIEYGSELFKSVHVELGVCYYIPLSNKWNAYIGDINENENELKVLFFFKKRMPLETGFYKSYEDYQEWLGKIEFSEDEYELDERKIIIVPIQ